MKSGRNSKRAVVLPRLNKTGCGSASVILLMTILNTATADQDQMDYALLTSLKVISTSEAGDKLALKDNVSFVEGRPDPAANIISISPESIRQTLVGIGSSFTESAAFVLAHLDVDDRAEVMRNIFGSQGADFPIARTPMGATDFSLQGRYSYADVPGDTRLEHFSIDADRDGFSQSSHAGIKDPQYDLLPMIREALVIKQSQSDGGLRIVASAWTAPAWMKDINDWYVPGNADNNYQGSGGVLLPEYRQVFADYITRYLDAYQEAGVPLWGLTPVNEPMGNSGQWESMHFTAESQNEFIRDYLGPKLHAEGYADVSLFMLDHSRLDLPHWAEVIYNDKETAGYVSGAAVHWYESTFKVYEDVFEEVHRKYPQFSIIHTEGTIDDLGNDAPEGVLDPEGFKEQGWFDNDDFWWNENATDWAYTVTWQGVNADDHPRYTPVHRYARNIIVSLNHWVSGWIDWNVVLDKRGGPNHVGNYCGAPIMIDTDSGQVYYTPIYYILAQFSRTIRPGDRAVQAEKSLVDLDHDALHASASINDDRVLAVQVLNTTDKALSYQLQIGGHFSQVVIEKNSLQTVLVELRHKPGPV